MEDLKVIFYFGGESLYFFLFWGGLKAIIERKWALKEEKDVIEDCDLEGE